MEIKKILVTGAGGFVGSQLIPVLLAHGFDVVAFDTFWFGNFLPYSNAKLQIVSGDLRNYNLDSLLVGVSHIIHLACISNDPSYELNESFSYEVNYLAQKRFIDACLRSKASRFIYASSSSVYGVKKDEKVTEDLIPEPITSYSKYKWETEKELISKLSNYMDLLILRPATLFGYAPRLRLDVVVNILLSQAFFNKKIFIHGGSQSRPQLSIHDMVSVYVKSILYKENFNGHIYNVGMKNYTVNEIAMSIANLFSHPIEIETHPIVDSRSYRIDCTKWNKLNIHRPELTLEDGLQGLLHFFETHKTLHWQSNHFHNVKTLKQIFSEGSALLGIL